MPDPHQSSAPADLLDVCSVVLCGGGAERMGGCDKPLKLWGEKPLVAHVLGRLPQGSVIISANRSIEAYEALGYPVVGDLQPAGERKTSYQGPLAGVAAAVDRLSQTQSTPPDWLYVVAGDAPHLPADLAHRFSLRALRCGAVAVCADVERLHPLPLLVRLSAVNDLHRYLQTGKRSVIGWLESLNYKTLKLGGAETANFANVNTPQDLAELNRTPPILPPSPPLSD